MSFQSSSRKEDGIKLIRLDMMHEMSFTARNVFQAFKSDSKGDRRCE